MPTNPGTTGLAAWWELNGDATDSHTSGLDMTPVGSPSYASGVVGQAVDLEASSTQYLARPGDDAALSMGDIDFTIGCWFQCESAGANMRLMSKRQAATNACFDLWVSVVGASGTISFGIYDATLGELAYVRGSLNTAAGSPHLVIARHDAAGNTLGISYDGGAFTTTSTGTRVPMDSTATFMLGQLQQVSRPFDGLIDEAFVYKGRALTDDEAAWLYNGGAGRSYTDVAGGSIIPAAMHHYAMMRG